MTLGSFAHDAPPLRVPPAVEQLTTAINTAGGELWLVGGGVRDHLLGRGVKDWDLEAYGLPVDALEATMRPLGVVHTVGRAFGVLKLTPRLDRGLLIDVSIPRRDNKVGPGHRGVAVHGDPWLDKHEATRRRDLTINAMMIALPSGELLDLHGGRADLDAKLLRAVDAETFHDDPLRALRAVQFAARLDFDAHPTLRVLMREAALDELPAERVLTEWGKLLLAGVRPSRGLALAVDTDVHQRVFPGVPTHAAAQCHASLDALASTTRETQPDGYRFALMLLAWLFDSDAPEEPLDQLGLVRWLGYNTRRAVLDAHAVRHAPLTLGPPLRHLARRAQLDLLLRVRQARDDAAAAPALTQMRAEGLEHEPPPRLVLGRDLIASGIAPGPALGELLERVYHAQLDGALTAQRQALAYAHQLHAQQDEPA